MNSYKKLLGNTAIFAIGNLGSKVISILLVPLYTYYLSTSEYGFIDIIIMTTSLLLPIMTLNIFDAVLRFVMDKNQQKETILTNGFLISLIGSLIVFFVFVVLYSFSISFDGLLGYVAIILILQAFQTLCAQFVRAVGKLKTFAFNGILMAAVIGGCNFYFLVIANMGVNGYLLSIIFMNLVSIAFLSYSVKVYRYIKFKKINILLMKKMLIYSIPLIPNAFMWWIMNTSNRYFILLFVGLSGNGLFAVATKIPTLLSVLNTFFFQAWQLSAIEEYDSKNKSRFYSDVFNYFSITMLLGTSILLVILKPGMNVFVSPEFYSAWYYVPFLLLGVVFASFSGFIGTNYIAAKKTNGVFNTSVIGGIVSIVTSLIFIPLVGAIGASISTMISFFVIWILRIIDTKKFVDMQVNFKRLVFNFAIIFVQIIVLYLNMNSLNEFIIQVILFCLLILINASLIQPIFVVAKTKMLNKNKTLAD